LVAIGIDRLVLPDKDKNDLHLKKFPAAKQRR